MNKAPYTILEAFDTAKEAAEYMATNELDEKYVVNHDPISGKFEIADAKELEKYKKVNNWENERHYTELRKKMVQTDLTEAKIICEVMVNRHPEMYVDALKEYIHSVSNFLNTFEEVTTEMQEERHFIYTGEEA